MRRKMKAIILDSGIGKRMKPFTDENPKCFARIKGKTILEHQIENLVKSNIKNIIITTGAFEDKIKKLVSEKFPFLNVKYVRNPKYDSTNYIYSLWLAKEMIDDEVVLLHGDAIFERKVFEKLLKSECESCVLVNNKMEVPKKDFKARVENGVITKIGVNVFGQNAFFMPPVYKISKDDFKSWLKEMGDFIEKGRLNDYAEEAFNEMKEQFKLYPVYYGDELCMEVDDFEDLKIAEERLKE